MSTLRRTGPRYAGALVALERNSRAMRALLHAASLAGDVVAVPAVLSGGCGAVGTVKLCSPVR